MKVGLLNTEAEERRDTERQVGTPAGAESRRAVMSSLKSEELNIYVGAHERVLLSERVSSQQEKVYDEVMIHNSLGLSQLVYS